MTYSLWEIDKQHFLMVDTLWLRIKQHWIKTLITHNISTPIMDICGFRLDFGGRNQIYLNHNINCHHQFGLNEMVYSIDKQVVIHILLFPYLEIIFRRINELQPLSAESLELS